MNAHSQLPNPKALLLTAYLQHPEGLRPLLSQLGPFARICCADGGYRHAQTLGLVPDQYIGDYDSAPRPDPAGKEQIVLPVVKDQTDTEAALDWLLSQGHREILILGGLGGRVDHTMGNLMLLSKGTAAGASLTLLDGQNLVTFLSGPATYPVPDCPYPFLSLLPWTDTVQGVTVTGCQYPLENAVLTRDNTLGISNQITGPNPSVSIVSGDLLVIRSRDVDKG